ncbi:hypothetical protein ACT3TP_14945 [Glutamicibacter sp. AOP38-B1-38]|uniref:hypothetical protein n=1 Tax=Glutamicibacter sp. AOP38-B1-38 TaxID=3457680 RepID=UPI0040340CED
MLASTTTLDAEQKIIGIFENWFRSRKFDDLPASDARTENSKGQTLRHQYRVMEDGTNAYRWLLTEEWEKAHWQEDGLDQTARTRITVTSQGDKVWVLADILPPLEKSRYGGDRPRDTTTPAFIQPLLKAVDFHDGDSPLSAGHSLVRTAEGLDLLLNTIQDENRRGMVLVTTPPEDQTPERWQGTVHDVLKGMHGLTSIHMVAGEKLDAFNSWMGNAHGIAPGSIRTYKASVDLDNRLDGHAHRIMQKHRIYSEASHRLNRLLRRSLIKELAGVELPDTLRRADLEFRKPVRHRQESSVFEQAVETVNLQNENTELNELLDASDTENAVLRALTEEIEQSNRELLDETDILNFEISAKQDELDRAHSEIQRLRHKLWSTGDQDAYIEPAPEEQSAPPESFDELLKRMVELPGVHFSGNEEITRELDDFSDLGESVVQKTWEVLRTFDAYAKARTGKEFDGGIFQYQRNTEHGFYMRIRQISAQESNTVQQNGKMRDQRLFPVPAEVDPSGQMLMYAHVPLATKRGRSPRLHFEDTWAFNGQITIGYIGPHLDNKSTN